MIFGLGLSAIVLAVYRFRATLRNEAVVIYSDNNAALAALVNGGLSPPAAFSLIDVFWFIAASFNIAVWMGRVKSKRNFARLPTRGIPIPFKIKTAQPCPPLEEILAYFHQHIDPPAPTMGELIGNYPPSA